MKVSLIVVRPWWCIAPLALAVLLAASVAGATSTGKGAGVRSDNRPSVTIVEPSAFDWGDAGIGAVGAFGLALLAGGVVLILKHDRRRTA